jgi:hypothetical protein
MYSDGFHLTVSKIKFKWILGLALSTAAPRVRPAEDSACNRVVSRCTQRSSQMNELIVICKLMGFYNSCQ